MFPVCQGVRSSEEQDLTLLIQHIDPGGQPMNAALNVLPAAGGHPSRKVHANNCVVLWKLGSQELQLMPCTHAYSVNHTVPYEEFGFQRACDSHQAHTLGQ